MTITASEILRRGKDRLMEDGWTQGHYHNHQEGTHCAVGGIMAAWNELDALHDKRLVEDEDANRSYRNAHYCLQRSVYALGFRNDITVWNDAPERTFHEVVDLFDRAEKLALIIEEE